MCRLTDITTKLRGVMRVCVKRFRSVALSLVMGSFVLCQTPVASAQVVINEFMAANGTTLTNALGETADWIELYNTASTATNLQGWYLTDSAGTLRKWQFPAVSVPGYGYQLVYASGLTPSMIGAEVHASFRLGAEGEYLALVKPDGVTVASAFAPEYPPQTVDVSFGLRPDITTTALVSSQTPCRFAVPLSGAEGTNWTAIGFNDSAWSGGLPGVGYDETGSTFSGLIQSPVPAETGRVYVRQMFTVENPAVLDALMLRVRYDDGFVAYLNGALVANDNAPVGWVWNSNAATDRSNELAVIFAEFDLTDKRHLLVAGTNVLALHALNVAAHPSLQTDLLVAAELSGDRYTPGTGTVWRFFHEPTPGGRNILGTADLLPPVVFSVPRGFQSAPFTLALSTPTPGAELYYTLNNTVPTPSTGVPYTAPIPITVTTVVRARAFLANAEPSPVGTHTYLFASDIIASPTMRTSITQDPVYGPQMSNSLRALPSISIATTTTAINWDPELPASVELILPDGGEGFQIDAGVARFGNYWQNFEKRMFRLYFRQKYGAGKLRYPLFKGFERGLAPVEEFDQLDLKSGSQDMVSRGFYMSEPFCDDAMLEMGNVNPHGRFVHLYLNGQYWGIYHLHERWEPNMLAAYFGGESGEYEAVDSEGVHENWVDEPVHPVDGDGSAWANIEALRANYTSLRRYLDVPQYLDFMLLWLAGYCEAEFRGVGPVAADAGGYRMWMKDTDGWLRGIGHLLSTPGPGGVFSGLWQEQHPDYVVLKRDHIQRHFFGDGVLTPARNQARLLRRCDELEPAFPAESARWGYRTPESWATEKAAALARLATQTEQVVATFRAAGWFPQDAPLFSPPGGVFTGSVVVSMSVTNGVPIHYTVDGSDPRVPGSGAVAGLQYATPLTITRATLLKARARNGDVWGPLQEALYVPAGPVPLRLTELMVHPRAPDATETNAAGAERWTDQDFEYVELQNAGGVTLGLAGLRFTDGIEFDFSQSVVQRLAPGEHVLVVRNRAAFQARYANWEQLRIAGEFAHFGLWPPTALSNAGETVRLVDAVGDAIIACTYADGRGWPPAADGAGHALVPLVMEDQLEALDYGGNWRAGTYRDGSPGAADPAPLRDVVLNEIVAHTDYTNAALPEYDSNDWLELYNRTGSGISLTDWYLSDDADALTKWAIPTETVMAAGGWRLFDEVTGFHVPISAGFGLNKAGETVYLSYLPGDARDRVADAVRFKAQANGKSLGRARDGDPYWFALTPTPGAANADPAPGVVISEFMYHPAPGGSNVAEFIELYNPMSTTAALRTVAGEWRVDGVDFRFPAGTTLAPGERVVLVGFDPVTNTAARTLFLDTYKLTNGLVTLMGPWAGRLDNRGERLALESPLAADAPGDEPAWEIIDEIIYYDRAPWPPGADGTGLSLQRVHEGDAGCDPANWYAAGPPTPGSSGERVALASPADGDVWFAGQPVPLRASVAWSAMVGETPVVAFQAGTNAAGVDASEPFEGVLVLPHEGRCDVRAELTDGAGVWTSRTAWVTALACTTVTVESVTEEAAELSGGVAGDVAAEMTLYWGALDGRTDPAAWEALVPLGVLSNASAQAWIGPLQPNTRYFARCRGKAGGRTGWSPESVSFLTPGYTQWPHAMAVQLAGPEAGQVLHDFPVLVRLGAHIPGFDYGQFGGASGSLRFTDPAGTRRLNHDVETWDTNGISAVWVQVPVLTNGTGIVAYWGGDAGTGEPPPAPDDPWASSVWSAKYHGVWHLSNDLADATPNGLGAVNQGSTSAEGIVGAGRAFDGVAATVDPGLPGFWYGQHAQGLTVSLWVRPTAIPTADGTPFGASGTAEALYAQVTSPRVLRWRFGVGAGAYLGETYTANAWQMLALVLSNGMAYAQQNAGPLVSLGAYVAFSPTNQPVLGQLAGAGSRFTGQIDEFRLSTEARSGTWLRAAYRTVAEHESFTTYGSVYVPLRQGDADGDGLPDGWERVHFADTGRNGAGDADGDGLSDAAEYVAGTDPTNAHSVLRLTLDADGSGVVWLPLLAPTGEGYVGLERFYDLLSVTGELTGTWMPVLGYTNLPGDDRLLSYTNSLLSPVRQFLRARTWLTPVP